LVAVREKRDLIKTALDWAETERTTVSTNPLVRDSVKNRIKSKNGTFGQFLAASESNPLKQLLHDKPDIVQMIDTEIAYEGYVKQHKQQILRLKASGERPIPATFEYSALISLSKESREVLSKVRPGTVGQASRLPGVTPSDAAILMMAVQRNCSTWNKRTIINYE
jgi:tRNA U34 5-carboxymethylaminomethyl modifying enzyme MnmG/GidA